MELKINETTEYSKNILNNILINKQLDHFHDRKEEIKQFLLMPDDQIEKILKFFLMGDKMPFILKILSFIARNFNKKFSTDEKLINNYQSAQKRSIISKTLRYTRYEDALQILEYINGVYPNMEKSGICVMDYGCGIADYGIVFAIDGYNVTLGDLEGGDIEFGKWRFDQRGLKYDIKYITLQNMYPEFPEKDVIIAGEVLEHVRDPLLVVKNFYKALPAGGFLWVSDYPYNKHKSVGGQHLVEAFKARETVLEYLTENFEEISKSHVSVGHLLKKRNGL